MRPSIPLPVIAATLLAACATSRQVQRPATVEELQQQIATESVSIGSRDPEAHDRVTLLYSPTREHPAGEEKLIPRAEMSAAAGGVLAAGTDLTLVRGYEVKRRIPGALQGMLIGVATGAVAGAAYGYSRDDPPCDFLCLSSGEKAFFGGLVAGVTGGLVGAGLGALIGRRDKYLF